MLYFTVRCLKISNVLLFASVALLAIGMFVNPDPVGSNDALVPFPGFPVPVAVAKFSVRTGDEMLLKYNFSEPVLEFP